VTEVLLQQTTTEPVDVGRIAAEVTRDAADRFPDAEIGFDGAVSARALAIPAIEDAIRELVDNAITHSDSGTPTVTVVVEDGDPVVVRVADDGPGVPDHEANIITEDRAVSDVYHASGMGMWLVRWIVRRSEGTVELDDTGEGTEFTIRLAAVAD
jgi:signal transduction histidine kinase